MGRGVTRKYRRVVAAFALLGVAFYALLLPGHLTSQFSAQLFAAQYGISAEAICQAGADDRGVPGAPATSCPICKGLAGFHLAIAPAAAPTITAPPVALARFDELREHLSGIRALAPRNRGPPSLPA